MKALNKSQELVEESTVRMYIEQLVDDGMFIHEDEIVKLKTINYAETNITDKIKELSNFENEKIDEEKVGELIKLYEKVHEIEYTLLQRKAIVSALKSNLFILTGGPGTGKTTVIKGLVFVYCKYHQIPIEYNSSIFEIKLIAPTGRAAKRMNETTNLHSETIHRFLGYSFDGKFIHNKDNLVDAKVIIIDEASMIDVFLASQLLQAIPKDTKVIIVGDEDQLPSVGPGQILKDFIDSDMIDYTRLSTIHRQANDSNIISLAHSINNEVIPSDILKVYDDRMFVEENTQNFQTRLISSIQYLLNQGYDLYEDIQILIPMYRGTTGIDSVNKLIQNAFNPNKSKAIVHGDREFRMGDKVIQLSNQIEDNVMNGDQGIVVGMPTDDILVVDFFGNEVTYKKSDLINIKHAYAMSIHKSQGSEYKIVIMPLFRSYSIMLKRKLIYTGVTRAKEKLILIGDINAMRYGVEKTEAPRQSVLKDLIESKILQVKTVSTKNPKVIYINDPSIPFTTLGEDLEEGITPYSFME